MLSTINDELPCDLPSPNILVQIPTSRHRSFQSNTNRSTPQRQHAEIKAEEIIKSELDGGQIGQAQPNFLRCRDSITNRPTNVEANKEFPTETNQTNLATSTLVTARPKSTIKCFKCKHCPFISILQSSLDEHEKKHNNGSDDENTSSTGKPNRKKLFCPGCDNVFYSRKPFKAHLLNDHQMNHDDTIIVLQSCLTTPKKPSKAGEQKIYLKDVEVLKNPNPNTTSTSIAVPEDGNFETNSFSSDSCLYSNGIEQEQQHDDNICIDLDDSDGNCNVNTGNIVNDRPPTTEYFCNKIFVRNVDNLNNQNENGQCSYVGVNSFMLGNGHSNASSMQPNILNHNNIIQSHTSQGSLPTFDFGFPNSFEEHNAGLASMHYDYNGCNEPYPTNLYEHGTLVNPVNINTILTSIGKEDNFEYLRQYPDNDTISIASNELDTGYITTTPSPGLSSSAAPIIRDERKKVFIKNIDILKKPIITTPSTLSNNRKSTLHLRTVDEVNLMLINKVHNGNYYNNECTSSINPNYMPEIRKSTATEYANYEINDFVTSLEEQPIIATPPTVNYFNIMPDSSANAELGCNDPITDNTVIILDDIGPSPLDNGPNIERYSDDGGAMTASNRPIGDKIESVYPNESGGLYSFQPGTSLLEPNDFLIVSSEEIINNCEDILDLTTDEVDQIFDDNLMNHNLFNNSLNHLFSPKDHEMKTGQMEEGHEVKAGDDCSIAKIEELSLKSFAECAKINVVEESDGPIGISTVISSKRKGGRPKGTRKSYYSKSGQKIFTHKCSKENCSIRFALSETIAFHEMCHTTTTKTGIHCPKCNDEDNKKLDWNWNTLHTHLWRKHNIDMELYSCTECSFKTPILSRLNNTHMKIHSNVKEYECDICAKAFKNSKQLKNHRRIHVGNSTVHKCDFCTKSFYNIRYLKLHTRTYHEQSTAEHFKCHICYKTFASEQEIFTHRVTHIGEKKFHCPTCKYKSNDHNALRRHQMTHNKEAMYKCPVCAFQCIQSTSYKSHILKKHPEMAKNLIFSCNSCDFKTVNKKILKVHQLKHGNDRIE